MEPSLSSDTLDARYIVNEKGRKTDVILSIKAFDSLLRELEDLYDIIEAEKIIKKKGKRYTLEEVERSLSEEG